MLNVKKKKLYFQIFYKKNITDKILKTIIIQHTCNIHCRMHRSEWLLWAILQLYHGTSKLFQWDDDDICFVLDQHA